MEVHDGFIVGVFNYCDRWCEACAFTSRCRLFADVAECDAALDPNLVAVVEAPPLPQEVPTNPPRWSQEEIDEMNAASLAPLSSEELRQLRRDVAPEHEPLQALAHGYCEKVHAWLRDRRSWETPDPADPRAVIGWFTR